MNQMYDYNQYLHQFYQNLGHNRSRAQQKKQEYLQKIMKIFTQFVNKCSHEIDIIIEHKLQKLEKNYTELVNHFEDHELSEEQKNLIIAQYLIKPFERFPFYGNKNEKLFKEQYTLIEKASLLIEQTLVDSFKEDQIPNIQSDGFFRMVNEHGIASQSLTKLKINPQNLRLEQREQLVPLQKNVTAIKMISKELIALVGDERYLQIWDLEQRICLKKIYFEVLATISCLEVINIGETSYLALGFSEECPQVWIYRCEDWSICGVDLTHTGTISKLHQCNQILISASLDGNVCLMSVQPFKNCYTSSHISSVQDLIVKDRLVYVFLICSSVCEYQLQGNNNEPVLVFRRTLSTGFISMIRAPHRASNLAGVACHIYGLSQIEITRKYKLQEFNIINISEMISDFIVLQAKETSQFFAICAFQNSSSIRIYRLKGGQVVYELASDYLGEAGAAGYLPKIEIALVGNEYQLMVVNQGEFDGKNTIRVYRLNI